MKTRCPHCGTHYEVDAEALLGTAGQAQCANCGTVFDAVAQRRSPPAAAEANSNPLLLGDEPSPASRVESAAAADDELPFDVPDDLPPIEPSPEDALDITETLYQKRSWRGVFYGLLTSVLILGLGAQLAWQQRELLLQQFPQIEPVCRHLPCRPKMVYQPEDYHVLSRAITPTDNQPGSLTLSATIRNDAEYSQHLPDIQLSLLDNNGAVLVRRRLAPDEYLFPRPPADRLVAAGEVFTIAIDFADPGYIASGFMIDFF